MEEPKLQFCQTFSKMNKCDWIVVFIFFKISNIYENIYLTLHYPIHKPSSTDPLNFTTGLTCSYTQVQSDDLTERLRGLEPWSAAYISNVIPIELTQTN